MVTKSDMFNLLPVILISVFSFEVAGASSFKFASSYGDHMVLQKSPYKSTIWGFASTVGETVMAHVTGRGSVSTVTKPGNDPSVVVWIVQLPPMDAGGPYTITFTSSEGNLSLSDVLFGDVWVCSGQSNMQFTMNMGYNSTAEINDADNYPNIRLFTSMQITSIKQETDFLGLQEGWSVSSKETVGGNTWQYFSALCFMYGKRLYSTLKYPIGLVATSYGGSPVEAWSSPDALDTCINKSEIPAPTYKNGDVDPATYSSLWNSMVYPLLNMTIYGTIWYQGETNSDAPHGLNRYNCTFPAMIDDWRLKFAEGSGGQTSNMFPFGFVQLAPYRKGKVASDWSTMRWHQTADYGYAPNERMKNTFMAVAMDLPDFTSPVGNIHPRDKEDVAERLYIEAMIVAYNRTDMLNQRGPFPLGFTEVVDKKTVTISYADANATIEIRTNNGFEVCCVPRNDISDTRDFCPFSSPSDRWKDAPITASVSTSVTIDYHNACSSSNPYLGGIRYEWLESPCDMKKCAVYNQLSGSPAPPFIHFVTL
ncbi:sialate O-acetylesterase-like [Haliotis asinina]|uniref:sialate O-acetylesterase-like n=1 Tax=Haliotis asinina TaxID=109174 RepID=UPI003531E06B